MKAKFLSVGFTLLIFISYVMINKFSYYLEASRSINKVDVANTFSFNLEEYKREVTAEAVDIKEEQVVTESVVEEPIEEPTEEVAVQEPKVEPVGINYRMTSYYTGDETGSTHKTGSGISTSEFEVNDKGWYTYEGKLVFATATNACLNSTNPNDACSKWSTPKEGRHYFDYFEEFQVIIDGVEYTGIVLDSCGASMYLEENRVDLFVANKDSVIDRGYKGNNPVQIFIQ